MDTDPVPEGLVAFSFQFFTRLAAVFAKNAIKCIANQILKLVVVST
jgi:hypothetical protein